MTPDLIQERHARILEYADGLERLVAGDRPVAFDGLAARRWVFTREMLLHCSRMNALLETMRHDARPAAMLRAAAALDNSAHFVALFRAHAGRWQGFPSAEQWDEYRLAIRRLVGAIRSLIQGEQQHILPLLPVQAQPMACDAARYLPDLQAVRRLIYTDDGRPRAQADRLPARGVPLA